RCNGRPRRSRPRCRAAASLAASALPSGHEMTRLLVPHLAAAPPPPRGGTVRLLRGTALGTRWSLRLVDRGCDLPALERAIAAMFGSIVMEMSAWEPRSALSRFNHAPPGSRHRLPEGLRAVLACALA